MLNPTDTDRTIPSSVQARNRLLSINQVSEVAVEEEEQTYPLEILKEEEIGYFIGGNTSTLMTLKKVSPKVNTAEAYINVTHGLSSEWKRFIGNTLLDWAIAYESADFTSSIFVEKHPNEVSTVDDRVDGIESEEVKRFCEVHGLEKAIYSYTNIVCDVLKNATRITISLSCDPEIENREKIKLSIRFESDSDIETMLELDEELFNAINIAISARESDYFVKTYDLNG